MKVKLSETAREIKWFRKILIRDKRLQLMECDTMLFPGSNEPGTLKELSDLLGKETIDLYNTSDTRGQNPSKGVNYQKTGKELPYLIVKSSDAHKKHRTGTRSSGRSSGQTAII